MTLVSDTQVDLLAEEVLESVYAGHNFQRLSIAQLVGRSEHKYADANTLRRHDSIMAVESFGTDAGLSAGMQLTFGDVLVHLDIDPTVSWDFRAQPGALRRIIMNLLGNSLKYTETGFIWITMRQGTPAGHAKGVKRFVLTVADSGKGISEEYLQSQIFTPFSQEDRLAPGTGLGLSLIQQITAALGGQVTVTSKPRRGTTVRITLPLSPVVQPIEREPEFADRVKELHGLRVCTRGFVGEYERVGTEYFREASVLSEAELMDQICGQWLGMHVVSEAEAEQTPPHVFLYSEEVYKESQTTANADVKLSAPVVVVCRNALTAHHLSKLVRGAGIFEFISRP